MPERMCVTASHSDTVTQTTHAIPRAKERRVSASRSKRIHDDKEPAGRSPVRNLSAVAHNARSALQGSKVQGRKARVCRKRGGADRVRTGDLLLAKQALSQLSYSPAQRPPALRSTRRAGGAS